LTDEQRPGAPGTFTFEQFMQIMALACEKPITLDVPVSAWTPRELADEAVKRGIVKTISPRTVERFLKGERFTAPSQAVLADPASRRSGRISRLSCLSVQALRDHILTFIAYYNRTSSGAFHWSYKGPPARS
jgi:hypothetical protein